MKKTSAMGCSLSDRIVQFIAFKRMQGYAYVAGEEELRRFDGFLTQVGHARRVLDADVLRRYADDIAGLSVSTRSGRLSTVRQFSVWLQAVAPESALLPMRLVPRAPRTIRFYPLTLAQVGQLMSAAAALGPDSGIRGACMRVLIGLLYSTGLRISEALALTPDDVRRTDSMLFVRRGKFRKERLVPMSASTREAMEQWLPLRARHAGDESGGALFVTGWNRPLSRDRAYRLFRRLCSQCGLDGRPPPRLHDLRHNYACACIEQWRRNNEGPDALLPVLAHAMGHADFHDTEIYIHLDAAALRQASGKFRQHVYKRENAE